MITTRERALAILDRRSEQGWRSVTERQWDDATHVLTHGENAGGAAVDVVNDFVPTVDELKRVRAMIATSTVGIN